jgi:vancomycin permeability regulator SanA
MPKETFRRRGWRSVGAAGYACGRLSPMLRDLVQMAPQLNQAGKVVHLLSSGDNSSPDYVARVRTYTAMSAAERGPRAARESADKSF